MRCRRFGTSVMVCALLAGVANSWGRMELKYWMADTWANDSSTGVVEGNYLSSSKEEGGFFGMGLSLGQFTQDVDLTDSDLMRVTVDVLYGHWFKHPFVGGYIGYDIEYWGNSDWSLFYHGPVVGARGIVPLEELFGKKAVVIDEVEISVYYDIFYSPILMVEGDDRDEDDTRGSMFSFEIGASFRHNDLDIKVGLRDESMSSVGGNGYDFDGFVVSIAF